MWEIVGLPDTSIKESKERIKAAIKNTGLKLESRRIIINLSPADTKKEGSMYDVPMAIGILMSNEYIKKVELEDTALVGELSLDGRIRKINRCFSNSIRSIKIRNKENNSSKRKCKRSSYCSRYKSYRCRKSKRIIRLLK